MQFIAPRFRLRRRSADTAGRKRRILHERAQNARTTTSRANTEWLDESDRSCALLQQTPVSVERAARDLVPGEGSRYLHAAARAIAVFVRRHSERLGDSRAEAEHIAALHETLGQTALQDVARSGCVVGEG